MLQSLHLQDTTSDIQLTVTPLTVEVQLILDQLLLIQQLYLRSIVIDPTGAEADSYIATNTYFIGDDNHTIIVVSCSGNGQENGTWPGGGGVGEPMHIEFFAPDGTFITEASGDSNEHGNDSNAYGQRGFDYITRDQMGYDFALEYELFHEKQRDEFQVDF